MCVKEGLGALRAERRKDLLEVRVVVSGGRDSGSTESFQEVLESSGEGFMAEERAAQLNMCVWKGEVGTLGHWPSEGQHAHCSHVSKKQDIFLHGCLWAWRLLSAEG